MTIRLLSDHGTDGMIATAIVRLTSLTRRVILDLVAGGAGAITGRLIMVTPNTDGSWAGRFPEPRSGTAQYWWVPSGTSPVPTVPDGWVEGDWLGPVGDEPSDVTPPAATGGFGATPFGSGPFGR